MEEIGKQHGMCEEKVDLPHVLFECDIVEQKFGGQFTSIRKNN